MNQKENISSADVKMKIDIENENKTASINYKLYGDNDEYFIKLPKYDQYIKASEKDIEVLKNTANYRQLATKLLGKSMNIIKNNINEKDVIATDGYIKIDNKKYDVVKIVINIDNDKLVELIKKIMIEGVKDKEVQKAIKENGDNVTKKDIDDAIKHLNELKKEDMFNESKLSDIKFTFYLNKDGYIISGDIGCQIASTRDDYKYGLNIKSNLMNKNGNYDIKIPDEVNSNNIDVKELYQDEDKIEEIIRDEGLSDILIPRINAKQSAEIQASRTEAKQIQCALAQYYANNDAYPKNFSELQDVLYEALGSYSVCYKNGTDMISNYYADGQDYEIEFNDNYDTKNVDESQDTLTWKTDTNELFQ